MGVVVSNPDIDSDADITSWAAVTRASGFDAFAATPSSANLRALVTDESGSGALLFANGALGTPSSGVLTNATGLPISTGVAGLGTGVATALAVSVGSAGAPVVNGGALGTPSSGTLTNATGLPIGTGVAGLGTNVATALGVNTGTDGAFVVRGGSLGTPSSATLTNATGLPISTGVSGLGTGWVTHLGQSLSPIHLRDLGLTNGGDFVAPWVAAVALLSATRKRIIIPAGDYTAATGFTLGNGTNSAVSTINGVTIEIEGSGGIGLGIVGGGSYNCRVRYTGSADDAACMFTLAGPIHDVKMIGTLYLDCANLAGRGFDLLHPSYSDLDIRVERYRDRVGNVKAYDRSFAQLPIAAGVIDNHFRLFGLDPYATTTNGINFEGGPVNNVGFSRNRGVCEGHRGGGSGTWSFRWLFCDNNWQMQCMANRFLATGGVAHRFVTDTTSPFPGSFPQENIITGAAVGGIEYVTLADETVASTTGGKQFFHGLSTSDLTSGDIASFDDTRIKSTGTDGLLRGGWAGSQYDISGLANPGVAVPATASYMSLVGICSPDASNVFAYRVPGDRRVRLFTTNIGSAPGGSATRTFTVYVNGVASSASVSYASGESGIKTWTGEVDVVDTDALSIYGDVTSTPAVTQATWTTVFENTEVH